MLVTRRIENLSRQIETEVAQSEFRPVIEGLMAYLGLVPSERSNSSSKVRASITKTDNSHVRRMLVDSAWTYRHPARKTAHLQRRAEKATEAVQDIDWKAQKRLCGRYRASEHRGKLRVQVCTAIARELTGFIWAIAREVPLASRE